MDTRDFRSNRVIANGTKSLIDLFIWRPFRGRFPSHSEPDVPGVNPLSVQMLVRLHVVIIFSIPDWAGSSRPVAISARTRFPIRWPWLRDGGAGHRHSWESEKRSRRRRSPKPEAFLESTTGDENETNRCSFITSTQRCCGWSSRPAGSTNQRVVPVQWCFVVLSSYDHAIDSSQNFLSKRSTICIKTDDLHTQVAWRPQWI